jgi:hypothetical protein
MAEITIPDIIEIGDVSTYLAANYEGEGSLFGERLAVTSPQSIQLVTDALRWQWEAFPEIEEVNATSTITVISNNALFINNIDIYVNDPILGVIKLGETNSIGVADPINDINYALWGAINNSVNNYGYNAGDEPLNINTFTITAPSGRGDSMNGIEIYFEINSAPPGGTFTYTISPFSGGVTEYHNSTVRGVANYLQWMCGKFGLTAQYVISGSGGGSVIPVPAASPNPIEFSVSSTSTIPSGGSIAILPSFKDYNIIFIRGGITQSTVNTGGSYFTWSKGTGVFTCIPAAYDGELFQIYPTI